MLEAEETFKSNLQPWWPRNPPIYDINKSYLDNAEQGPFFSKNPPRRVFADESKWIDFLGFRVASPLGIPAGPLLNSKWVELAANLGFDVLCYKTIRSSEKLAHPLPNMIYVDCKEQLIPGHLPDRLVASQFSPSKMDKMAVTNSFGMPSRTPDYLSVDIPRANNLLKRGQIMIVSVTGSPGDGTSRAFMQDFFTVASQAKDYGAKVIEVNFSCPNVSAGEGEIYTNPETIFEITRGIVKVIKNIPLIVKVGVFSDLQQMEKCFIAATNGGARGICGINTISMKVVDSHGKPALGSSRKTSGICGNPIRHAALDFIRNARSINRKHNLGLTILGTGGVVLPGHFNDFLEAGADVAMSATGMLWEPYLAYNYHKKENDEYS